MLVGGLFFGAPRVMVCGARDDRYSGRRRHQRPWQSEEGWCQYEQALRHHSPPLGRLCGLAPFFAPRFFGKTKKCGSGCRG